MKKKLLLLFIGLIGLSYSSIAQNTSKWEVDLNYTFQFDLNKIGEQVFNGNESLHQYGISIKRILLDQNRFQILRSIGYARQQVIGGIGVNHCYDRVICNGILLSKKNYTIQLAEVPLSLRFAITKKQSIDLTGVSQFRFHQNSDYDLQSKFLFELNSIAIYPAVSSYQYQNWRFSLGTRLMNWQKPDETFYYKCDFLLNNPDFYQQQLY